MCEGFVKVSGMVTGVTPQLCDGVPGLAGVMLQGQNMQQHQPLGRKHIHLPGIAILPLAWLLQEWGCSGLCCRVLCHPSCHMVPLLQQNLCSCQV